MKKQLLFAGLLALVFSACLNDNTESEDTSVLNTNTQLADVAGLQLDLNANPEWQFENLRLYPVYASQATLEANVHLPEMKSLAQGMDIDGFRITERKQFGRERSPWYNALTVQNKSSETIFLMSGDVITGGNQDRVIAYDDIIPPGTVKNIEVFCVEEGRSSYYDPTASEADKRIAAFSGYYNVASPQVRQAVYSGKQKGVWKAVDAVTAANQAQSNTQTYAALETENQQKADREAYLHFFKGKFSDKANMVGVLAVSNNKVIGIDIFGTPTLFQQQFDAILHGYATEAATASSSEEVENKKIIKQFKTVAQCADPAKDSHALAGKCSQGDNWVHLFKK